MTIFELVKIALDELYQEARKTYGDKVDDTIRERIAYLAKSYGQLTKSDRKPVNYRDPATRFAYVFKYVAAHGDYVVQVMEKFRAAMGANIFTKGNVRVSCIGGGPGSDIIAVLKYLDEYGSKEPVEKVTCYLLDREQAWADTWTELDDSFDLDGIALNTNFQALDVTDPGSWESQQKFLQADLFTLSYFVSEVSALDGGVVSKFWATLFDSAKPGALFVYDDNGSDEFNDYFDAQWKKARLECLITANNTKVIPRFSEQASELAEYREKFDHNPKIQSWISYRVLRKPA